MRNKKTVFSGADLSLSRRRFVQGMAMGGIAAGMGLTSRALWANTSQQQKIPTLAGKDFELAISEQVVNFTGTPRIATTVNGSLPAPILRWKEGDTVTLRVKNNLPESSSIHWHGIILPSSQDGVPNISDGFSGIAPGATHEYRFKLVQSGTYWYHSHSGFQEQTGLYGPIIVDPIEPEPFAYDRDYVVMLSDWTDEDPTVVYAKLKKLSHYYNFNERTHKDLMKDLKEKGLARTWSERKMWMQMRMSQRDLADVTGYTYTYLMNGQPPADGWMGVFRKGEKILLRFINGSAMSFFDVRIPGLKMTVVAADGQYVQPVSVDEFRIGVAETYDVIVEPDDSAYSIFAQSNDRSGYARGTLTPDPAMTAEVPAMDPVPNLTHADMGMDMSAMDHSMHDMGGGNMQGMDHSQHEMGGMDHSKMAMGGMAMKGMDHSQHDMGGMDHSNMAMGSMDMKGMDHSKMPMNGMDHSQHQMPDAGKPTHPSDFSSGKVVHAPTEYGPHVDMRSEAPQYRLSDPGVGLRNNGRRVLTYADLKSLHGTHDPREPDREIQLHLTGNMSRYMWSVNGVKFANAEPLRWKMGERLRITFVNDTMMNHPMHLHGMWSDMESANGEVIARRHTISVQPAQRVSFRVTADALGNWAWH
ncbi:MAG TPA: copper resistance system multicopper oxidase, partial [Chromatiaceae bacterium]|nr:copper resistance system multicopper oxidase [Chromatiaceae bacterium]